MKKISLLFIFISSLTLAQRTGHNPLSLVSNVYFNEDYSKFLSRNLNEIGYWDVTTPKPIWVFETKGFGCDYTGNFWYLIPHANLDYFSMVNYSSCNKLIDTKKLIYSLSVSTNAYWVNGKMKIIETTSEKEKWLLHCYDVNAKEKKVIHKDKVMNMHYLVFENKIYISDKKNNKTKRYDIASEKWDDYSLDISHITGINKNYITYFDDLKPFVYDLQTKNKVKIELGWMEIENYKLKGTEYFLMDVGTKTAHFYDIPTATRSKINIIFKHQNNSDIKFVDYDPTKKVLYFIENESTKINNLQITKSFLTSYNKEGNHLNSILLTETNTELIAEMDKNATIESEKRQAENAARNTPENRLRIRLSNLYNQKFINTTNKRIYQVVPDKPIYEGNLVRLNALHHDNSKIEEVYEKIDNLEDQSKYTSVKQFGKCFVCNGQGVIHQNGTQTVADYEYTLGVKVVKTTTKTSGCQHCGGGGIIVKE